MRTYPSDDPVIKELDMFTRWCTMETVEERRVTPPVCALIVKSSCADVLAKKTGRAAELLENAVIKVGDLS